MEKAIWASSYRNVDTIYRNIISPEWKKENQEEKLMCF